MKHVIVVPFILALAACAGDENTTVNSGGGAVKIVDCSQDIKADDEAIVNAETCTSDVITTTTDNSVRSTTDSIEPEPCSQTSFNEGRCDGPVTQL